MKTTTAFPPWYAGKTLRQFFKYGVVGIVNTIVTLGAIFLLMRIFGAHYLIANVVGYVLGFANSFLMNKIWTFRSKGEVPTELALFILVFLISYAAQLLFLVLSKEYLSVSAEKSQVIAMIFYTIVNFIGNKQITFRRGSAG